MEINYFSWSYRLVKYLSRSQVDFIHKDSLIRALVTMGDMRITGNLLCKLVSKVLDMEDLTRCFALRFPSITIRIEDAFT